MTLKNQVILGGVCGAAAIAAVVWMASTPSGGVKLSNEMEQYALKYIEEHKLLEPAEELVAYYDVTLSQDGTEAAILTTRRVVYHKDGRTEAIALADVDDVQHRKESLIGDIIEVHASSGKAMKIEIAPMNQGETFRDALMRAWKKAKPDAAPAQPG